MTKTVQFRNIEDAVNTYKTCDIPAFAIFMDKQLFLTNEDDSIEDGAKKLKAIMDMLLRNRSAAIYTVCVYKKVPEDGITNVTPYNSSFNFRLIDQIEGYGTASQTALESQLAALKLENEQLLNGDDEDDEDDEDKVGRIMGHITKFLDHPKMAPVVDPLMNKIGGAISAIFDTITPEKKTSEGKLKRIV